MFKKSISILSVFLLTLVGGLPIAANAFITQSDDFVFVGEEEVIDDNVALFGDTVDILGTIQGDVIVASGVVNIKGTVEGDVIGYGKHTSITGNVTGDVRVIGSVIDIDSIIGGNITAAGENITIGENAEVGHSISVAAALFEVNGAVVKNINVAAGSVTIDGPVGGSIKATIDPEGNLVLLSESRIGGDINYSASRELQRTPGAEVAGVIRKIDISNIEDIDFPVTELYIVFRTLLFLGMLIIGFAIVGLFPKQTRSLSDSMIKEPVKLTLLGFAYFFLLPILFLLLFATIIGIPLALILMAMYFIGVIISQLVAGVTIGILIVNKSTEKKVSLFFPIILGILLVYIVTSIPFFGWVVSALLTWWGLAGIIQWWYTQYRNSERS